MRTEVELSLRNFHSSSSLVASLLFLVASVWYLMTVGLEKTVTSMIFWVMVLPFLPLPFFPFLPPFPPLVISLTSLVTVVSVEVVSTSSSLFFLVVVTLVTASLVTVSCLETFSLETETSSSAVVFSFLEVLMISSCSVTTLVRDSSS